jgi:unsaturated chondroitin disaccharide hydrolase
LKGQPKCFFINSIAMKRVKNFLGIMFCLVLFCACRQHHPLDPAAEIDYCKSKVAVALAAGIEEGYMPRNIKQGEVQWNVSRLSTWTAGYWPGILWYIYEYTGDEYWRSKATHYTNCLKPNWNSFFNRQDFGLSILLSFGQGYRLTGDSLYKNVLLQSAAKIKELQIIHNSEDSLSEQISSDELHSMYTVISELRYLNLLFWAGHNGCDQLVAYARLKAGECYDLVNEHFYYDHTSTTIKTGTTNVSKAFNELLDEDKYLLSKDIAWLIYGFTALYRDNPEPRFLMLAQNLAGFFIAQLPDDYIPGWSFGSAHKSNQIKDASAAAIAASALLQLAGLTTNNLLQDAYISTAGHILQRLSSKVYRSDNLNHAFIMHSVGNSPYGSEADVSLIYADYYYLEALIKYKDLLNTRLKSAAL